MFSSLRNRLWLSYALIITSALLMTMLILFLYLLRSPLAYRNTLVELEAARNLLLSSEPGLSASEGMELDDLLRRYDRAFGLRFLVVGEGRQVLADSRAGQAVPIKSPKQFWLLASGSGLRDEIGQIWLFSSTPLADGRILVVLTPRPRLALLAILRNDLLRPFLYAGALSLLLSLFMAFALSRWISTPLQNLITASKRMPEAVSLSLQGPREVQELTRAYNDMTTRLARTQQAQREFVANVSHELKTPITSIQGFAQALQDGTAETPEERQQAAGIIQGEADRMNRMVLTLLDLTRIDSGTLDLQLVPVDLPALLETVREKFEPLAHAATVALEMDLQSVPAVRGDGDRLAQVFNNLVDNALKFTPPGGKVTLRVKPGDDDVLAAVEDTGCGISEDALPHIFERFYQVDTARSGGNHHGVGLGLSIVKEILHAQGGKITVQTQPGQGSTFCVSLPVYRSSANTTVSKRSK